MSPGDVTLSADQVLLYTAIFKVAGSSLILAGVYIWKQGRQLDDGCDRCGHCQGEREERKRRAEEASARYAEGLGLADHPELKRKRKQSEDDQARATRERLFGRQVVDVDPEAEASPPEGPHDGPDGNAGG